MNNLPLGSQTSTRPRLAGIGVLFALIMMIALTVYQSQPPSPKPLGAPASDFSAERAMDDLKIIAAKPHPTGSTENAKVRDYLVQQLKNLGVTPELQTGTGSYNARNTSTAASVTNVMARLKGTDNTKAVLLMSHYDSVPTGPGANDDGVGVVAELETLRALLTGSPLKNDVIFLFTDGEELGLIGADVFWNQHPWAQDVGVVLNFEARGSKGASLMFQTSKQNGWLIDQFAEVAVNPVTNSLMGDLYRKLPNNTDMTISNEKGVSGLNFAYGDGWPNYHSTNDNVENVDLATLQHHGENAYTLVKQLGNQDLTNTKAPDSVYFSVFGQIVHYPQTWALPIAVVVTLLFAIITALGVRKQVLSLKKVGLGFLVVLLCLVVSPAISLALWLGVQALWAGDMMAMTGGTYYEKLYAISFVTLTLAITTVLAGWFSKRVGQLNLLNSGLLLWVVLMLISALLMPGASFVFTWPLLISLIVFGLAVRSDNPQALLERPLSLLISALPVVFFSTLMLNLLFIFMPVTINAAAMVIVVLGLILLLPHLSVITQSGKRWLPVLPVATTCALLIFTAATADHDSEHPLPNNIFYYLNQDTGQAAWIGNVDHADSWLEQFLGDHAEAKPVNEIMPIPATVPVLTSQAPSLQLNAPALTVLSDQVNGNTRDVLVGITSSRQASTIMLGIADPTITEVTVNGKLLTRDSTSVIWNIEHVAPAGTELKVGLKTKPGEKFKVVVSDVAEQLPNLPGKTFTPRPDDMMPAPEFDSSTLVSKTYTF